MGWLQNAWEAGKGMQQIGDYVIVFEGLEGFGVRMAGDDEYISRHPTEKLARAAIKRYQAGDRRRA